MLISVPKKKFAEAVHIVSRFAQKGTATLPALSAIVILAGTDGIKLRATNLETGIDLSIQGTKKEDGVVAIPAHLLQQFTASLGGEGDVTIEHAGDRAVISAGTAKSTIRTLPYEDFPVIPFPESSTERCVLSGALLKSILPAVASCASASTVRPELASISLSISQGTLTLVATDSFRLVEKKIGLAKSAPQMKFLIPAKNALDIAQALPDEDVIMVGTEHQCSFIFEHGRVVTRLTNALYPDYKQIIPKESAVEASAQKKDLEAAMRRVALFSDQFQKVKIVFDPKKKSITLSANNPDIGDSSESIPAHVSGSDVELSFNHRYLAAALPLVATEQVSFSAAGVGRPLTIRGVGDATILYLVSPMNQ